MTGLRIGSLFSGAGMLDEGVRAAIGGDVVWHCEYDRDASAVLAARYPDIPNHRDVTAVDWRQVEPVDVLTGGYPCQPFSTAGRRKGHHDPRHLWPYFADAIGALRPRLAVLENVAGHLTLGGTSVVGSLAGLGYDARWGVVRAADAGAPHRRARLFIVATDATGDGRHEGRPESARLIRRPDAAERSGATATDAGGRSLPRPAVGIDGLREPSQRGRVAPADAGSERHGRGQDPRSVGRVDREDEGQVRQRPRPRQEPEHRSGPVDFGPYAAAIHRWEAVLGVTAPPPTEPGANGPRLSPDFTEWLMGWPIGWTDVGISRNARLRICGNGVVPQQAALALDLLGVAA